MQKVSSCLFSFICASLFYHSYSQTTCSDSVITRKYSNDNWKDLELLYADPVVMMKDSTIILSFKAFDSITPEGIPANDNSVLVKLNNATGISWGKMNWIMNKERFVIRTLSPLNNGDILIQGNISVFMSNVSYRNFLGRVDSSGTLKWLRLYKENSIDLRKFSESETGDLYTYTGRVNTFPVISRLTGAGEEVWSNAYDFQALPAFNSTQLFSIKIVDTFVYAFYSNYDPSLSYSPISRSSILLLKIGLMSGKLSESKSFNFPEKHNYYINLPGFFDDVEGHFVIWGSGDSDTSKMLFKLAVDKNLSVTQAGQLRYLDNSKLDFPVLSLSPTSGNLVGTLVHRNDPKTLYYFSFDRNMNRRFQRKLILEDGVKRTVAVENSNSRISLISFYYGNFYHPHFTVTDFSTDFFSNGGCTGEDNSLFSLPEDLKLTETKVSVSEFPYKIESIQGNITEIDYPIDEEIICRQVNICDSIRIKGPEVVCDINEAQIFHIDMRQECLKKVEWQIDSTIAYPLKVVDDKTISIRFREGVSGGYLKAAIPSCEITDSLKILLPFAKNAVNLGSDTTLCNKSIILRAGHDYQTYRWQDGSISDTLIVFSKGKYWVQVTDACGRESSDTVFVKDADLTFSAGVNQSVCLYDSVYLQATKGYYNYQWNPDSTLINQEANIVTAFPEMTTKYIVSAERFPGCLVKDSVVISVKECPQKIFFPNAFSPNGDGLNDLFRPAIDGSLSYYRLSIYNRYGQVIFQSKDAAKGWDGYFKGQVQPIGLYVWVCEYAFRRQPKKSLKGRVSLIR